MYIEKIRTVFENHGFKANSTINKHQFNDLMTNLMYGEPYDELVCTQLWQHSSNGQSNILVNSICESINQGITILISKLDQINQNIVALDKEKVQKLRNSQNQVVAKLDSQIANLKQDKDEYEQDLKMVTIPFGINLNNPKTNTRYDEVVERNSSFMSNESGYGAQNDELKWVFYLSLVFALIEVIIIYGKYDFLNLIVLTSLLSIYLLNHYDNIYIKLTLSMLILSEVLDIIWLFMFAGQKWNPPKVGNDSTANVQYLRFIVIFTVVIIVIKIPLGYYLYTVKSANDKYVLNTGLFKVILNANKSNPVTRGLNHVIGPS